MHSIRTTHTTTSKNISVFSNTLQQKESSSYFRWNPPHETEMTIIILLYTHYIQVFSFPLSLCPQYIQLAAQPALEEFTTSNRTNNPTHRFFTHKQNSFFFPYAQYTHLLYTILMIIKSGHDARKTSKQVHDANLFKMLA